MRSPFYHTLALIILATTANGSTLSFPQPGDYDTSHRVLHQMEERLRVLETEISVLRSVNRDYDTFVAIENRAIAKPRPNQENADSNSPEPSQGSTGGNSYMHDPTKTEGASPTPNSMQYNGASSGGHYINENIDLTGSLSRGTYLTSGIPVTVLTKNFVTNSWEAYSFAMILTLFIATLLEFANCYYLKETHADDSLSHFIQMVVRFLVAMMHYMLILIIATFDVGLFLIASAGTTFGFCLHNWVCQVFAFFVRVQYSLLADFTQYNLFP